MPHFGVDGAHGLHVGLAPLPTKILGLHLEELQHIKLKEKGSAIQSGFNQHDVDMFTFKSNLCTTLTKLVL